MNRRPLSKSTRQWLLGELDAWHLGGILSADQSVRILELYETPAEAAGHKRRLATFTLGGLAALMIGLAVLLVIGYNWQELSPAWKLTMIFGALVGLHGAGFWLRYQRRLRLGSEIAFFLACLLYGAAIWLIAQIFHIQSHYPDGLWFWALGVLPFALCLDTLLMHVLYAGLLALWVGTEILGFHSLDPWWVFGFPLAKSALTLPLLVLPGLLWAYRKRSPLTIAIYAPVLAWWAVLQPVAWHWAVDPIYFIGLAGAMFLLIAEMHREGSRLAAPYRFYGVLITAGTLVPLSFADYVAHDLHHSYAGNSYNHVAVIVIGLIGAVAALGVVLLQRRDAAASSQTKRPFAAILRRQWLPLALIAMLAGICFWTGLFGDCSSRYGYGYYNFDYSMMKWAPQVWIPTAAANVMMIVLALWLMRLGLREDRTWPFAAGVLYFLLWTVLRYADLFGGEGGMLGAAAMFLLCGIGLFAVARFWLHRKETGNV